LKIVNNGIGNLNEAEVKLIFPSGVTVNSSSIDIPGYVISGDTITWNLTNLNTAAPLLDYIDFDIPGSLASNTQHTFTSSISALGSTYDCNSANNMCKLLQIVGNNYGGNVKCVDEDKWMSSVVQNTLTYNIVLESPEFYGNFQTIVTDTLSPNLDWNTFELINASHSVFILDLGNGIKQFHLNYLGNDDALGINPATGLPYPYGNIMYRIKELSTNGMGSTVHNTAHVYYDWTDPVATNTTENINTNLGLKDQSETWFMAPNPSSDEVTIVSNEHINTIELMDQSGKIVHVESPNTKNVRLSVQQYAAGIYLIRLSNDKGVSIKKLVKK
jgi:hypothetical protein